MDPNYFFARNTTFLTRQYNWSNMFNTITTCRLSHYFRLKTCSSFLSHSQGFHLMFVIKYVTVLSGKYPANFTWIPDGAGCLHFIGYRIVLSGSGTSLICRLDFVPIRSEDYFPEWKPAFRVSVHWTSLFAISA